MDILPDTIFVRCLVLKGTKEKGKGGEDPAYR
jgi:hypothetical protein